MNARMMLRGQACGGAAAVVAVLSLMPAYNLVAAMPETIERVKPSIVAIGSYQKTRTPAFAYRGTGFVVADGTLIATNAHVLPDNLSTENRETLAIAVFGQAAEPQLREAKAVGVDKTHDLALLRVSGTPLP